MKNIAWMGLGVLLSLGVVLAVTTFNDDPKAILGDSTQVDNNEFYVYFSIKPKSVNQFAYTEGVVRSTDREDRAWYAMEQLLQGPTQSEQDQGFYSSINVSGESICDDKDFLMEIDPQTNVARIGFCKTLVFRGRGDNERVQATIVKTLSELPEISSVIIGDGGEL